MPQQRAIRSTKSARLDAFRLGAWTVPSFYDNVQSDEQTLPLVCIVWMEDEHDHVRIGMVTDGWPAESPVFGPIPTLLMKDVMNTPGFDNDMRTARERSMERGEVNSCRYYTNSMGVCINHAVDILTGGNDRVKKSVIMPGHCDHRPVPDRNGSSFPWVMFLQLDAKAMSSADETDAPIFKLDYITLEELMEVSGRGEYQNSCFRNVLQLAAIPIFLEHVEQRRRQLICVIWGFREQREPVLGIFTTPPQMNVLLPGPIPRIRINAIMYPGPESDAKRSLNDLRILLEESKLPAAERNRFRLDQGLKRTLAGDSAKTPTSPILGIEYGVFSPNKEGLPNFAFVRVDPSSIRRGKKADPEGLLYGITFVQARQWIDTVVGQHPGNSDCLPPEVLGAMQSFFVKHPEFWG